MNRRTFLTTTASSVAVTLASRRASNAVEANDTVVLAIVGANSRGSQLATTFAELDGAEIAYVCDCDERAIPKGIKASTSHGSRAPKGIRDFRRALDDPAVDAIVCAAPNHWHAAMTILACQAGKHVYVEKPVSHTPDEGERMIAAAKKSNRVVQAGLQRRSGHRYREIVQQLRDGVVGRLLYARSWYFAQRPTIGHGKETETPAALDYNLWQGPSPERAYRDNVIHYNWHFFWHWGNGEIGNNGVHTLDVCRWAMDVDYPIKVTSAGANLRYDDDQETPDTCTSIFDFGGKTIVWEGVSWSRPYMSKGQIGMEFRGEKGSVYVDDEGYTIHAAGGKVTEKGASDRGDIVHQRNFLQAVRNGDRPGCTLEDGHKSTLLCQLGNIAYRTGEVLKINPSSGRILGSSAAEALWARDYRPGWMPDV
jgi:predicted dehydrogenase